MTQAQASAPELEKNPIIIIEDSSYAVPENPMTGAQLRALAVPPIAADRDLWLEDRRGEDKLIKNDEKVHLRTGDHFFSTPRVINPGARAADVAALAETRAPALVRPRDLEQLAKLGRPYTVTLEGEMITVVVAGYEPPGGLSVVRFDLLLRLPRGFPDVPPDMFWCAPALRTAAGAEIAGTQAIETYANRSWQRWSRHFKDYWRPGIDDMAALLAMVRRCLADAGGVEP